VQTLMNKFRWKYFVSFVKSWWSRWTLPITIEFSRKLWALNSSLNNIGNIAHVKISKINKIISQRCLRILISLGVTNIILLVMIFFHYTYITKKYFVYWPDMSQIKIHNIYNIVILASSTQPCKVLKDNYKIIQIILFE